jgi:nitroimidazol reductase NimA-like FMN-containing flavoprotein (pyridoxamine 5'-phosphate oxidase superfamily)
LEFDRIRSKLKRIPARGHYDKDTIYKIVDEALYCHVSFVQNEQPFIIPTIHARIGDNLFLHGAKTSRMLKHITNGNEICVAVTILDELVLARSVFHHSMNYRSVVLFGKGIAVTGEKEKLDAFKAISNHTLPGRWEDARQPNKKEINSTVVVSIKIDESSAKIRTGPPIDDEEDYMLPVWAGVLPVLKGFDTPRRDPKLNPEITIPEYLRKTDKSD